MGKTDRRKAFNKNARRRDSEEDGFISKHISKRGDVDDEDISWKSIRSSKDIKEVEEPSPQEKPACEEPS